MSAATAATTTTGGNSNDEPCSQALVTIRVLVAGTGVTYKVTLHPAELTVANIRSHLAAAVHPSDQILLLGPPYKVPKDSTLQAEETLNALRLGDAEDDPDRREVDHVGGTQTPGRGGTPTGAKRLFSSTERSGARRLFLFSKQALSESAPDPPPCDLQPMDLTLPSEPPGPSPLNLDPSGGSPPLHHALAAYERQFMLSLSQGRVLADGADLRLSACRKCVSEQAVMARALRAAVSNLSDHFHGAARTRAEFTAGFQAKSAAHADLLGRFGSILTGLQSVPLHPSLVSVARASGRAMETLIDTVPVEKERAWAQQCQTSHQRLSALFGELDTAFAGLGTPASREEEARLDREAEREVEELWSRVEGPAREICALQAQRAAQLTSNHREAVKIVLHAINSQDEDKVQAAFTPLREMSTSSKDVVPAMIADDAALKDLMQAVSDSKTRTMKRMKVRLRDVSTAQSSIQRVLSSVGVLRDAMAQQAENMVHLEHVAELPNSYRDFLSELRRRRAYGNAVTSSATAMMERLASMRNDEVKAREKFLRGPGRHLMPAFFEIFAPTLATPPPLYTPQLPAMVEMETLPDVGHGVESSDATMTHGQPGGEHGVSIASTLTAESHQNQTSDDQDRTMVSSGDGAGGGAAATGNEAAQRQDQLIVSASEQSGTDLILDPAGGAAVEAEAKTLAYENAVLRQALERMGGKPPRAYIEEAKSRTDGSSASKGGGADGGEIAALRRELAEAKTLAAKNAALAQRRRRPSLSSSSSSENKKLSDKISHSSFDIGDVGLFMPTGRGSGGKRTYLAFHTNCPHRYLSSDCIKGTPDFVLGRIVYQEELVAGEAGTDANPYGLHVGTKFWVLTVEVLNPQT